MIQSANNSTVPPSQTEILITELSLSGNMNLTEMRDRKIQWKTVDPGVSRNLDFDTNMSAVVLEP